MRRPAQNEETRYVRALLIQVGVCPECHWRLAVPDRLYCRTCLNKYRDAARKRNKYKGKLRCGLCRCFGHDRRGCWKKVVPIRPRGFGRK